VSLLVVMKGVDLATVKELLGHAISPAHKKKPSIYSEIRTAAAKQSEQLRNTSQSKEKGLSVTDNP